MAGIIRILAAVAVLVGVAGPLAAADEATIKAAIAKGVKFLKDYQPDPNNRPGSQALVALALYEGGVPANDPYLLEQVKAVREAAKSQTKTYQVSLCLMLLDRNGDRDDVPLMQLLALRLAGGQCADGGWGYDCPMGFGGDRLGALLQQPKDGARLHPEVDQAFQIAARGSQVQGVQSDNSNTQFAVMAMWIARKHGAPVDPYLARCDARFRTTQVAGGWAYNAPNQAQAAGPSGPMTCAGLLGLAIGHGTRRTITLSSGGGEDDKGPKGSGGGNRPAARDPLADPLVQAGMATLGYFLTAKGPAPNTPPPNYETGYGNELLTDYYFLWSMERVAVTYGVDKIGGRDWYAWGSAGLLAHQKENGSWSNKYDPSIDTSFGVLFLARANLARDLSSRLKHKPVEIGTSPGTRPDPPETKPKEATKPVETRPVKPTPAEANPPARPKDNEARPPRPPVVTPVPPKEAARDTEATKLADELATAPAKKQEEILGRLKDGRGNDYTEALAGVMSKLADPARGKAREALAERLTRMTADTLRDKLKDDNREIRRAAALACAMKDEKNHVPDLIEALADNDTDVVRAARAGLRSLTSQDFGPTALAPTAAEKAKAAAEWRAWWLKEKGKK